jgi:predicted phage gp36 major capsid-like protein
MSHSSVCANTSLKKKVNEELLEQIKQLEVKLKDKRRQIERKNAETDEMRRQQQLLSETTNRMQNIAYNDQLIQSLGKSASLEKLANHDVHQLYQKILVNDYSSAKVKLQ